MMRRVLVLAFFLGITTIALGGASWPHAAHAQSEADKLRAQISERNDRLAEIEKEIAAYQAELQKVGAEKATLQSAISQLELERKKVNADITYTQNRIGATDLTIAQLEFEIADTERTIERNKDAIGETLARLNATEDDSLVIALLQHDSLTDFWESFDELATVRSEMGKRVSELLTSKLALEDHRSNQTVERERLVSLKTQYDDQNRVLANNKAEKDKLLQETKNEEAEYQKMLAEKEAAKARFESELRDLEARLQFTLDPTSIPSSGTAVFRWPLDSVRITQSFGYTQFAQTAAYSGNAHNGIDIAASRGTAVYAALGGTVAAVNVQVAPMCQYGKWVIVRHANGLSTLYAHLSVVSVNQGDEVSTGQIIGYSGDTGYATGPHLHFTVYASKAVNYTQYTCNSGITLTIPIAAASGYLNPLNYLPAI